VGVVTLKNNPFECSKHSLTDLLKVVATKIYHQDVVCSIRNNYKENLSDF